jgi:hypothetical protein
MRLWKVALVVFSVFLATTLSAQEIHRCIDESGNLVMTDDPGKFPPGCRPVETKPDGQGTFNVLPSPDVPAPATENAQAAADRVRAEISDRQEQIAAWKDQARQLVSDYQAAETRRNQAFRRWSYSSREVVRQAQEQMAQALEDKEKLLQEVDRVFVPAPDREEIRRILEDIP